MSVPAPLRRVLEGNDPDWSEGLGVKLYINYNKRLKQNLRVYSMTAMTRIAARIDTLPEGSPDHDALTRLYLGQSELVTMDKDGRIVLPQKLRDKLGVTSDAELTLMGLGQFFEIWPAEAFDAAIDAKLDAYLAKLEDDVDPLSRIPQLPPGH